MYYQIIYNDNTFIMHIDKYIIPLLFNSIGYCIRFISWVNSCFQNGKVQSYILYSIIFVALMLLLYLYLLVCTGGI